MYSGIQYETALKLGGSLDRMEGLLIRCKDVAVRAQAVVSIPAQIMS
jgi:hypothetical protein